MTQPRSQIVDTSVTCWYHCISRCVRSAFLLAENGSFHRKEWIDNRIKELESIFAISVAGFSILDNHLHMLIRIDPDVEAAWTPTEVVTRYFKVFPHKINRKVVEPTPDMINELANNAEWVDERRSRLGSLSWFMKCLKEPLARLANKEDNAKGAFFQARFKSVAIVDTESLLTAAAYIDLNPVAAGIVDLPEHSPFTSIKERVDNVITKGRLSDVAEIRNGSVAASKVSEGIEDNHWLIPIEDRRKHGALRAGIMEGFTLGNYLMLVDCSARVTREGKASIPTDVQSIFERLNIASDRWFERLKKLMTSTRLVGSFMATSRSALRAIATKLGVRHLVNTA